MNKRKLFATTLGAAALVMTLCGCPAEQLPTTALPSRTTSAATAVAMPVSETVTTAPGAAEMTVIQASSASAASQQPKANVKKEGVSIRVIGAVINTVGHNREGLIEILGVPDETPINSDDNRAYWAWTFKVSSRELWTINASTTNSTKLVDHVFVNFGREIGLTGLATIFKNPIRPFWGGESWSDKKELVVTGTNADGKELRAYCDISQPLVVSKPYIDGSGKRVDRFIPNPDMHWVNGIVRKIAVGANPIMNASSDKYLFNRDSWKELK